MTYENIIVSTHNSISTVTINRPSKLNALNTKTIQELQDAFEACEQDQSIRVLLITGSGDKAFVAGADIKEFADYSVGEGTDLAATGQHQLFDRIENFSKPVIAVINSSAKMGLPEVSLGLIPGYGGTQRLPQLIGKGRAMEMMMTAGMITADQALDYGLVNHVVPQGELTLFTLLLAEKIIKNSPNAIRAAIQAINAGFEDGVNGFDAEIEQFGSCFGTDDFKEGTQAFLEKREAKF